MTPRIMFFSAVLFLISFSYANASQPHINLIPLNADGIDIDIVNKSDSEMTVRIGGPELPFLPQDGIRINAYAGNLPIVMIITAIAGGIKISIKEKEEVGIGTVKINS